MQNQIAYVVLHYKTADETELCVSKLSKLKNKKIVIVCNGSKNGSDEAIVQRYCDDPEITVLINDENLGFANGLNEGIRYAREKLQPACIVCINNDVYIDQPDFSEELLGQYERTHFAVAAPDVLNLDGMHCNPGYMAVPTEKQIQKELKQFQYRLWCSRTLFGIPEMGYRAWERIQRKIFRSKQPDGEIPIFHGCCWIFSREYFAEFDGVCSRTYLYGEEPILSYLCYLHNMRMEYLPTLTVVHGESVSTKREMQNFRSRKVFYYENLIKSTEILLELVQGAGDSQNDL